jgi:hypothetical protein
MKLFTLSASAASLDLITGDLDVDGLPVGGPAAFFATVTITPG